ncbi:MAG: hypothetical protein WCG32_04600 [Actinomycetes bacterium]
MIWFISLLALIALFMGTLTAASSEFLVARQVTDFAEEYGLSLKTLLNQSPSTSIDALSRRLNPQLDGKYRFRTLKVKSLRLEQGQTVHVEVCVNWESPIAFVFGSREICEEAYAR